MEMIEKITIRCFVLGMAFILIWFLFLITGDWVYDIHSTWFELTEQQFAAIHYSGLMFAKVSIFIFFLFPYIACKWARKKFKIQDFSS